MIGHNLWYIQFNNNKNFYNFKFLLSLSIKHVHQLNNLMLVFYNIYNIYIYIFFFFNIFYKNKRSYY